MPSTIANRTHSRLQQQLETSTNGAAPAATVATPQMTAVEILAQLTPSEVTESLEDLERKFAAQQDHYIRQKKLLTTILKGLGVKQSKFGASAAEDRELRRDAILKLVGELKKADTKTIIERCGLPNQGARLMLRSLVAKNKLKQLKTGEYVLA